MRCETARARPVSEVTKTSACNCVSATNSASYVVSPPELVRNPPSRPLEHLVTEEANLQRVDPRHPLHPLGNGDLTATGRLVQRRQRLRADECRCDELVFAGDLDLAGRNPEQRVAVNDKASHEADATRASWPIAHRSGRVSVRSPGVSEVGHERASVALPRVS